MAGLRTRPVDIYKQLAVVKAGDLTFEDDVEIPVVEHPKKKEIITPSIVVKSNGSKYDDSFQPTDHYIYFHLCSGAEIPHRWERYEVVQEDVDWLKEHNRNDRASITDEQLEDCIFLFEKQSHKLLTLKETVECSHEFPLNDAVLLAQKELGIRQKQATAIYQYWMQRRVKIGNALIRFFQAPPPFDDPSPNIAFRPRERERRFSHRNPRKNDAKSYEKMRYIRRDYDKVLGIIDAIKQRESLKRDRHLIDVELFDMTISEKVSELSATKQEALAPYLRTTLPRSEYSGPSVRPRHIPRPPPRPKKEPTPRPRPVEPSPPPPPAKLDIEHLNLSDWDMPDAEESDAESPEVSALYHAVEARLHDLACAPGSCAQTAFSADPFVSPEHLRIPFGCRGIVEPRVSRLNRLVLDRTMAESMFHHEPPRAPEMMVM